MRSGENEREREDRCRRREEDGDEGWRGGGEGGHGTRIYNVKNPTLIFPRFIVLLPISPFSLHR